MAVITHYKGKNKRMVTDEALEKLGVDAPAAKVRAYAQTHYGVPSLSDSMLYDAKHRFKQRSAVNAALPTPVALPTALTETPIVQTPVATAPVALTDAGDTTAVTGTPITKLCLLVVKNAAERVGGLDRLVELATLLKQIQIA